MSDLPAWFNPDEYSHFLTESMDLFEFNIPYQKKKQEIRMKRRRDEASWERRKARERAQEAQVLADAKAKGIMQGLGEQFKSKLMGDFLDKLSEQTNPLQQEKQKMRPEVDPKDRDRDRKREERREKKKSGLADVLIVRNKRIGKIEIITTEDFNEETHQVLKGKVRNIDKGPVSKPDLIRASKKAEFMNTKTSIRLIGKVEKEEENKEEGSPQQESEATGAISSSAPPPPPNIRVPNDGKEITDVSSTYPDWDHQNTDLMAGIAYGLNQGQELPPELLQKVQTSRTLGDAINRTISELLNNSPSLAGMQFQILPPEMPASPSWYQLTQYPAASPVATVIGTNGERLIGVNIKVGQQIRPGIKGEPQAILEMLVAGEAGEKIIKNFSLLLKDFYSELREVFMTKLPVIYRDEKDFREGRNAINKEKMSRLNHQDNKNIFKNRAKQLIEDLLNVDEDVKAAFILECLTGNMKFDGGPGSAQLMIALNKDGSNPKLITLDQKFAIALAESESTYLSTKFIDEAEVKSPFEDMFNSAVPLQESAIDLVGQLEKIQELSNPLNFIKFFEMTLTDVVYTNPIEYSEYYDVDSDGDNVFIMNPGTTSEKEIRIPIKKTYDTTGKEENVMEKGADHILEEYGMINDYLVDLVNNGDLPRDEALQYIREQFNFLTERNYRKEYDNYHSKPEQRANRSKRVLARRKMEEKGRVHKGDGKDVNHKDGNPQNNSEKNLEVMSKSKNRSMNEDHGAGFEGTPELVKKLIKDTPFAKSVPVFAKSKKYKEK